MKSLSESEQREFKEAKQRQETIRQQFIDNNTLAIDQGGYVWKAQNGDPTNKPNDPVWDSYWNRWLTETEQSIIDNRQEI